MKGNGMQMLSRGLNVSQALGVALAVALCAALAYGQTSNQESDVRPLPVGGTVERNIKEDDNHFYPVELKAGQVLRLDARGKRANLNILLGRVADKSTVAMSAYGFDRVALTFIAKEEGQYIAWVSAGRYTTGNGSYQLTASVNQATDGDTERVRAEQLLTIGNITYNRGDEESIRVATAKLEESLKLWQRVEDPYWESVTLYFLGLTHYGTGEFGQAWKYLSQAIILWGRQNELDGGAWSLSQLGLVYLALGDPEKALEYMGLANRLFAQLGDARGAMATTNNIGLTFMDMGNPVGALEYFNRALPFLKGFKDSAGEAAMLANIGKAHGALGEARKELDYTQQALQIFRATGDYSGEATMRSNIGSAYIKLGEIAKAFEQYHQALPLYKVAINKRHEARTFSNLMEACQKLHRPRLAVFYGKQAINLYQELRGAAASLDKETQQAYLKSVEKTYRTLSELLIEQERLTEALQLLNSFKDQQFFDFNSPTRKAPVPLTLSRREASFTNKYKQTCERAGVAEARLKDWQRRLENSQPTAEEAAHIKKLEADYKTASDGFLLLLKQAETEFSQPLSEEDRPTEVGDLREMQATLTTLNQSTGQRAVALYTLIGEDNYRALIVAPDSITVVSKPIKGKELNSRAKQLWALLQQDTYDPRILARELYSIVFEPIKPKLPRGANVLLWSLDGNLRYVPMAALYNGQQYLVELYRNVNFTRADYERLTRGVSPKWTGIGFGSANAQTVTLLGETLSFAKLPGVETELSAIFRTKDSHAGIVEGEVWQNEQFNQTAMLVALNQRRPLVHIASHFSFRPGDEARSFLLLGDGTAFTLSKMKEQNELFAGVELLTLSACNTAAQQAGANGREIDGFAELAQRLGAAAVMATLWNVADNSTPWLMRDFYQSRQNTNRMTKAAALQQAQLALLNGTANVEPSPERHDGETRVKIVRVPRDSKPTARDATRADIVYIVEADAPLYQPDKNKRFAHPYYWAPFILIGNWR